MPIFNSVDVPILTIRRSFRTGSRPQKKRDRWIRLFWILLEHSNKILSTRVACVVEYGNHFSAGPIVSQVEAIPTLYIPQQEVNDPCLPTMSMFSEPRRIARGYSLEASMRFCPKGNCRGHLGRPASCSKVGKES